MVQGRIEPTPAEQLSELRKARDRYAALAEKLHEGADPELKPDEIQAREQNALRILHAYEKSVANSEVRMTSLGKTHRLAGRPLGVRTWLLIFVAISAVEGGVLLAYFRPAFFAPVMQRVGAMQKVLVPVAPPPAPFPAPAPDLAAPVPSAPILKPQPNPPQPAARPQSAAPAVKAAPKPITPAPAPPPRPAAPSTPSPVIAPPVASPIPAEPPPQAAPQQPPPAIIVAPPPAAAALPALSLPPPLPPQQTQPQQTPLQQAPPAPRPTVPATTRLEAIAGTHTPPPYPDAAKRLGETGTTQIRVAVSPQGAASDCRVVKSSGSDRLDAAACSHVQQTWRWKPASLGGQPVASAVDVTIVWNLKDAR